MSDAKNEISKTVYIQGRTALGLTLGLACSIPLSSGAALAAGNNHDANLAANLAVQQMRADRRADRKADRLDRINDRLNASINAASDVGANFNLNSGNQNFSANNLGNFQNLTIDVGGSQRVVTLDSKLTAAEVVAAQQILNGGVQTIELKANGRAVGGTIALSNSMLSALDKSVGGSIGSLTVARNVEVIDSTSGINLSGNLKNMGTISAASGLAGQTVTISADNIHNARHGSIGSYVGNDLFSADVALNAATSLINNGSISSAGTLTISAPVINNVSEGSLASMYAGQSVNLNTQNLVNTGNITSAAGDINVNSTTALNVVGTGSFQANNGDINFGTYNANIDILGGHLSSQQVNLTAGTGIIEATVGTANGTVNSSACVVHFNVEEGDLTIGDTIATDDPIFTATGNVVINGAIAPTGGAPLTVLAGGDITATAVPLSTAGAVDGGDLSLLAGVQFANQGGNFVVTKSSKTGGKIDLTGITSITTAGGTGIAGDITLVAFAGKTAGTGTITVPTGVTLDATGATGNGNVLVIAGASKVVGPTINLGGIEAEDITIQSATPSFSKGGLVYDATGQLTSGSFLTKKLNSGDINLNGLVDATGDILVATGGQINVNGSIKGSSTTGSQSITLNGDNVNLAPAGSILAGDNTTLNITTPNAFVVDGNISVGTFNLTAGSLNITTTGRVEDAFENITITKGGGITVNGVLGRSPLTFDPTRTATTFNINSSGLFLIGDLNAGAVVSGDGQITAASFINNATAKGNTTYTASGKNGVLFANFGTVDGQIVTINAVGGSIFNAVGADLMATQQVVPTDVPVLTLNTLAVDNLGHIEAVGELKQTTGTLNINSTKALTITGVDGGFYTAFNSSVNLSAVKGDVIVGGNDGVVNSNPFSGLATGLGNFSVVAPKGSFLSTMPGVSVTTDGEGKQGTVLFTVEGIEYNGVGAAPNFAITAVGDAKAKDVKVVTIDATDKDGITIGSGPGEISIDVSLYDPASLVKITTPANLNIDSTALVINKTSLELTGTKGLLITGDIIAGDKVTINTSAKKIFEIGNATVTGIIVGPGEGITANETVTINAPGAFVMSNSSKIFIIDEAKSALNLNGPSIEIQNGSDIDSLNVNLTTTSTKAKYTNLNPLGALTAGRLNIIAPGVLTLDSGSGKNAETFLTLGNDFSNSDPALHSGGTFNLNAASLSFSSKGIFFNVPGSLGLAPGGGKVDIDLTTTKAVKVGLGNGAIRANVAAFPGTKFAEGAGEFRISSAGAIVATEVKTGAINFGFNGGAFALVSTTSTVSAKDVTAQFPGDGYNLFQLSSNSSNSLLATDASNNGVQDKNAVIFGGNIVFTNFGGKVVTNGATLAGVTLELDSSVEVDVRKNAGFGVAAVDGPEGSPGSIIIKAPILSIDGKTGLALFAEGSDVNGGGNVLIDTSAGTQNLTVAAQGTGGAVFIDVSDAEPDNGGVVTIKAGGALDVSGLGLNFGNAGIKGSVLDLTSGQAVVGGSGGSPLTFRDANSATLGGLAFGTVNINSGSSGSFSMNLGGKNGNGFVDGNLTAGKLVINPIFGTGNIDTTGYQATIHDLVLTGNVINFDNQTIAVVADGPTVGTGDNSGRGGKISITADSFTFDNAGGVLLQAQGIGGLNPAGVIKVDRTGTSNFDVSADTISFDVSNPGGVGGEVAINTQGDMTVDGTVFQYGDLEGGKLGLKSAGNMVVSNVASLSAFQLNQIDFATSGGFNNGSAFKFGGAGKNENGIADVGATLTADIVTINSGGKGAGVDATGGDILANSLTIKTSGSLNLESGGGLTVVASDLPGVTGNGGTLDITAANITQTGVGGYLLSAAGTTGAGGIISVTLTGSDTLVIDQSDMNIDISNAAGVRGGVLSITNGGNITGDFDAINVGANFGGAGPNVSLTAKGVLAVNNVALIADIGLGGGLITSATIGGAPAEGYTNIFTITDPGLANGMVSIEYEGNPGDTNQQIAEFIAAQINSNAELQNLGVTATTSGAVITLISNSNLTTYSETSTAPPLPAEQDNPTNIALLTSTTGLALNSQSQQAFVLGGAAAGTNGIQDSNLNLNMGAITISNTGTVALATVGSGGAKKGGSDFITVTDASLPGGVVTIEYEITPLESRESIAQGLANAINLNLDLQAAGVTATVDGAEVTLLSTGNAQFSVIAAQGSKLDLATVSAGGDIQKGNLQNIAGAITDVVTLSASGDVGSFAAPINIDGNSSQAISVSAGGDAYISSTTGASTLSFGTSGHTEATFTGGDVGAVNGSVGDLLFLYNAAANTNSVTIGSLTSTAGDLYFESDARDLIIDGNISSNFGNIVLQNTAVAGANIQILTGTRIHGSGAVTALNQGNVYITIGLAPPAFTPVDGVQPAGTTVTETGGGQVTFGSAAFPAGSVTADVSVIFEALGRNLALSTGGLPSTAITIGADVIITADPPPLSAPVQVFGGNSRSASSTGVSANTTAMTTALSTSSLETTASNMVPGGNSTQSGSLNLPSFAINSSSDLLSALSTINTVGLNNAQLTNLSSIQNATLNAVEVSNTAGLLSTGTMGQTSMLSQQTAEATPTASEPDNRTLVGRVSNETVRKLDLGPLLVAPENDIVVETPFGKINVAAKTLALLIASDKSVAVYNLHDHSKGALNVVTNQGHTFNVSPGTSAVIVHGHEKSFEDVNPAGFVRYRKPISKLLSNSHKLYRAEFEIISLLNGLPAFKELITSENKETRKTMLNVLKTAAILMQLSGKAEPFEFRSKPEVTAMTSGR